MIGRKTTLTAALLLTGALLLAGCDGVLLQRESENGRVDRLRLDGGESWSSYDTTPRYRSQKGKDQDDYCIMLKNEATF